jgi:hypothetical protein
MVTLGPLPCIECKALVVYTDDRALLTHATQLEHGCEAPPRGSSYRDMVRWYGEDEALVRWGGLREVSDKERARKRDVARRRRARLAAAA